MGEGDAGAHAHPGAPAVALSQASVTFRLAGGLSYSAVERTSLAVGDGEFVAIVGPTGCGKSTLLNVAAGLIASPAEAQVEGAWRGVGLQVSPDGAQGTWDIVMTLRGAGGGKIS